MRQNNSILEFYRQNMKQDSLLLSGHKTIDNTLHVYKGTSVLLNSEPYSGSTALCLEYADYFTQTGVCFYIDCNDSVLPSRLGTISEDNFFHIRPNGATQLLEIMHEFSTEVKDCLIILDSAFTLLDGPTLTNTVSSLRKLFPASTILTTFRNFRKRSSVWSQIIDVSNKKNHYLNRVHLGHFVSLKSKRQETVHFLSYKTGRFSRVYDQIQQEVLAGKSTSDFFEFEGQRIKGFWNTLEIIEQQKHL
jgi:hypothetical protein